jgi:hypothetical protein
MKKTRIRFFKFSDGKQNLQFHWPKCRYATKFKSIDSVPCISDFFEAGSPPKKKHIFDTICTIIYSNQPFILGAQVHTQVPTQNIRFTSLNQPSKRQKWHSLGQDSSNIHFAMVKFMKTSQYIIILTHNPVQKVCIARPRY